MQSSSVLAQSALVKPRAKWHKCCALLVFVLAEFSLHGAGLLKNLLTVSYGANMYKIPLYRSIWKPILFMGCERGPFLMVALSSGLLIMEGSFWLKIIGIVYFVVMVAIMAYCNSKDPFFFQILYRYLKYQNFYLNNALHPGSPDKPENF